MGTIADKLAKLNTTKAALKSAINGSGNVVGDVFSTYPSAITTGKSAIAQANALSQSETTADATFEQMAANIGQFESGAKITTTRIQEEIIDLVAYFASESPENSIIIIRLIDSVDNSTIFEFSCKKNAAYRLEGNLYLYSSEHFCYDVLGGEAVTSSFSIYDGLAVFDISSPIGPTFIWTSHDGFIEGEGIEVEVTLIEQN